MVDVLLQNAVHWQPRLGAFGELAQDTQDVSQAIRIILLTRRGQDPLRPEFGSDVWQWVDRPIGLARPNVVRETIQAIGLWEPRAVLESVVVSDSGLASGQLKISVAFHTTFTPQSAVAEVVVGG